MKPVYKYAIKRIKGNVTDWLSINGIWMPYEDHKAIYDYSLFEIERKADIVRKYEKEDCEIVIVVYEMKLEWVEDIKLCKKGKD